MIVAKPVIDNQYWILQQDNQKVGNIQASGDGYVVKILNQVSSYKTIPMVRKKANIEFETAERPAKAKHNQVHGFDTGCRTYNAIWNVQMRVPLFTKQAKSKSWYAAGWYRIRQHRHWRVVQNPKLIALERYEYHGPFHTALEARP